MLLTGNLPVVHKPLFGVVLARANSIKPPVGGGVYLVGETLLKGAAMPDERARVCALIDACRNLAKLKSPQGVCGRIQLLKAAGGWKA